MVSVGDPDSTGTADGGTTFLFSVIETLMGAAGVDMATYAKGRFTHSPFRFSVICPVERIPVSTPKLFLRMSVLVGSEKSIRNW